MIYLFHHDAGQASVNLSGDDYKHIIKARRHQVHDHLTLRHPDATTLYEYEITLIDKKTASLRLISQQVPRTDHVKRLHLGWALVDPKSIEKVLPALCEIGVSDITLLRTQRTQQQFKIDHDRLERIIRGSMQQSGRIIAMNIHETALSLEDFLLQHPKTLILDFCDQPLQSGEAFETVVLGPEGGFSDEEKALFENFSVRRLNTPNVLRSETAAVSAASLLLL